MVKISLGGDIQCKGVQTAAMRRKYGGLRFDEYLGAIAPLLRDSDYVIANLETPVCPSQPLNESGVRFNAPVELLDAIKAAGINFVSTANNHCLDCGAEGVRETIHALDAAGLQHAGTYLSPQDADQIFTSQLSTLQT